MRAAPLLALVVVTAGCGGGAQRPASALTPAGRLFADTCGACHTLAAADTHGTASKSLDEVKPSTAAVLRAIATGPGAMPAHLLSDGDATEVARFVAAATR